MVVYRSLQLFLRAATSVFFREIRVVGTEHVPPEGARPVLFAGNHPNSLIDPVLLCTTSGRIVHFAAKDKLFVLPLAPVLYALGAVPIARRMDHAENERRSNTSALERLYGVLARGRSVGIFPEGLSHNEAHLQRLRTGAARIALEAAAQHPDSGVQVICCGLHYMRRRHFRSRVLVQYGEAIDVGPDWIARHQADSFEASRALTERIDAGLRALTVNAADWETLRVLDGVRRLYQPRHISLQDRVELSRRFTEVYPSVSDEPVVTELFDKVQAYLDRLDDVGLSDRDLVRGLSRTELFLRAARGIARLMLWLPLAIPGAPVHVPLLLLVGWMGRRFAPRRDVIGTSRLVSGMLMVLAAYVLIPLAVATWVGTTWAIVVGVGLPLSGFATLRVLERGTSLRRMWRSFLASFRLGYALTELRLWRDELQHEVIEAVRRFIPADMEPLFPEQLGELPPNRS